MGLEPNYNNEYSVAELVRVLGSCLGRWGVWFGLGLVVWVGWVGLLLAWVSGWVFGWVFGGSGLGLWVCWFGGSLGHGVLFVWLAVWFSGLGL
eukprot:6371844-Amphidinium_carterae.1